SPDINTYHGLYGSYLGTLRLPIFHRGSRQLRSGHHDWEGSQMLTFPQRILFVGFGAVARCTLPILLKHISIDPKRITIMDFEPNEAALQPWIEQGMTFVRERVTPENLGMLLGQHVSARDLLIDLAWNIDCCEIVQWCHDRGV